MTTPSELAAHSPRSTPASDALHARALQVTPGGVHSNVRLAAPRVFFERAEGAWLWDVDGHDYIDYLLGQGPNFLGHAPAAVVEAVAAATRGGTLVGGQHRAEVEAAELLRDTLGWPDLVRLGVTGTEMVQAALRLARAATGRKRFVRFDGHYHGWLDNVLIMPGESRPTAASAGQLDTSLAESYVLPWNDAGALEQLLEKNGGEIAAVITEPMMLNAGAIEPTEGYLEAVREACDRHGVVLIFDEVITGFRLGIGGGVGRYGVTPDLATYGKAIAGGWPVAALAGTAELMERFGAGEVNHSGTFNASVMSTAALIAAVGLLREDPPYERIDAHGRALIDGIREIADRRGVQLAVRGLPAAFHVAFGPEVPVRQFADLAALDRARYERLAQELCEAGIWVAGRGVWYVSAAHGDRELEAALERFERAIQVHGAVEARDANVG